MSDLTVDGATTDATPVFCACPASDAIDQLVAALAKAQGEFQPIGKDLTARINSAKGAYSYDYADLAAVFAAVRPALSKHGIAVFQPVTMQPNAVTVKTVLAHTSGQWISTDITLHGEATDPRAVASVITYARRYGLLTMAGVAPSNEDDDAEAASTAQRTQAQATTQTTPAAPQGYDNWLSDLQATADTGPEALNAAWVTSKIEYRQHLTKTDPRAWLAIKKKADKAAPVPA